MITINTTIYWYRVSFVLNGHLWFDFFSCDRFYFSYYLRINICASQVIELLDIKELQTTFKYLSKFWIRVKLTSTVTWHISRDIYIRNVTFTHVRRWNVYVHVLWNLLNLLNFMDSSICNILTGLWGPYFWIMNKFV